MSAESENATSIFLLSCSSNTSNQSKNPWFSIYMNKTKM